MIRDNDKYINDESSVIYVLDNCSSEVLNHLDSECIFEVGIGDDDCSCDECEKCLTINGKPATKEEFDRYVSQFKHGDKPTTTSSVAAATYCVNGKEVDKNTFEYALADIEDRCLDDVRDMLLGYYEIMDEVNDWRSRFLRW